MMLLDARECFYPHHVLECAVYIHYVAYIRTILGRADSSGGYVPPAPAPTASRTASAASRARAPAGAPRTVSSASSAQVMELKNQLADITNACAATEKERDFYFDSGYSIPRW